MRKIVIMIIILSIIIIVMISINNLEYQEPSVEHISPIEGYSNIRPMLKTGDIMLFICMKHETNIDKFMYYCRTKLIGSDYGHVGIIIREGDQLYITECTDTKYSAESASHYLNDKGKGGVRYVDLDVLIEEYNRDYGGLFGVKFISEEIPNHIIINNINKHKHKVFESKVYLVVIMALSFILPYDILKRLTVDPATDDKIYCSEFVYTVLRDCGVMSAYNAKLFFPNFFTQDIFENTAIIPYSPVVQFHAS